MLTLNELKAAGYIKDYTQDIMNLIEKSLNHTLSYKGYISLAEQLVFEAEAVTDQEYLTRIHNNFKLYAKLAQHSLDHYNKVNEGNENIVIIKCMRLKTDLIRRLNLQLPSIQGIPAEFIDVIQGSFVDITKEQMTTVDVIISDEGYFSHDLPYTSFIGLEHAVNLKCLDAMAARITENDLEYLYNCKQLQHLCLPHTTLQTFNQRHLAQWPSLLSLQITGQRIAEDKIEGGVKGFELTEPHPSLKWLELSSTRLVTLKIHNQLNLMELLLDECIIEEFTDNTLDNLPELELIYVCDETAAMYKTIICELAITAEFYKKIPKAATIMFQAIEE